MKDSVINVLQELFERDLNRLKKEIQLYKNEKHLWIIENDINNSGGNLCLHLVGNLRYFIGAKIGKTGYIRKRDLEFSSKDLPVSDMLGMIDETISDIDISLENMTKEQLKSVYPIQVFKKEMTTEFFLLHLSSHLNYHLGQISYHRRILDK